MAVEAGGSFFKPRQNGPHVSVTGAITSAMFCYGICYMYRKWIDGKYELSADEAADLLFEMMPESLSCYWMG